MNIHLITTKSLFVCSDKIVLVQQNPTLSRQKIGEGIMRNEPIPSDLVRSEGKIDVCTFNRPFAMYQGESRDCRSCSGTFICV